MQRSAVPHDRRRREALLDLSISEQAFQSQIVELATLCGWHWLHVRKSVGRRDGTAAWQTTTNIAGWVDLLLWHERWQRIIGAEVKAEKGKPTNNQKEVLRSLAAAGIETYLWRPSDWDSIKTILNQRARP